MCFSIINCFSPEGFCTNTKGLTSLGKNFQLLTVSLSVLCTCLSAISTSMGISLDFNLFIMRFLWDGPEIFIEIFLSNEGIQDPVITIVFLSSISYSASFIYFCSLLGRGTPWQGYCHRACSLYSYYANSSRLTSIAKTFLVSVCYSPYPAGMWDLNR